MKIQKDVTEYFDWLKAYLEEKSSEKEEVEVEWVWYEVRKNN